MLSWLLFLFEVGQMYAIFYIGLDSESQKICVISTPFGLYEYKIIIGSKF